MLAIQPLIHHSGSTMGSLTLAEPFSIFPLPAYKVSKAALNSLTIQWAQALSGEGFVVTSINPGVSLPFFLFFMCTDWRK